MRDWLGNLEGTDDPAEALGDLKATLKSIADAFMTDFIQIYKMVANKSFYLQSAKYYDRVTFILSK